MLYAYSNLLYVHSKYSESNISMNPLGYVKERRILLADSQFGISFFVALATSSAKCCTMRIQNVSEIAQRAF